MQSSVVVAGMDAFELSLRKHFDTSGKSVALFHHRAICKTPVVLPDNGLFGAIARLQAKNPYPQLKLHRLAEVASARHSEGSPLALPSRARFRCASPRRYGVNTVPDLNKATD